jgi:hypothetical protein
MDDLVIVFLAVSNVIALDWILRSGFWNLAPAMESGLLQPSWAPLVLYRTVRARRERLSVR